MNKNMSERLRVEKEVLSVFQKVNPSTYHLENQSEFDYRSSLRKRLFQDYLKFPIRMFKGAKLLDFGCGTGEHAIYYSVFGAKCTLVEMNPDAIQRARDIWKSYAPANAKYQFINSSYFEVDLPDKYDIVCTEGSIHHTTAKEDAFDKLVSYLKTGGFVYLNLASKAGFFQRNLQRMILYKYADSEQDIVKYAMDFFAENIERSHQFGHRTKEAIIYDNYVNPKWDCPSVGEIMRWFKKNNLVFYSSWPNIIPLNFGDSPYTGTFTELMMKEGIAAIPQLFWMCHQQDDNLSSECFYDMTQKIESTLEAALNCVKDVEPSKSIDLDAFSQKFTELKQAATSMKDLYSNEIILLNCFIEEVLAMLRILKHNGPEKMAEFLKNTRHLFRGTNGLGGTYFIAYKPEPRR